MSEALLRRAGRALAGPVRKRRLREWALLAALWPSLSFMGHWTPRIDIPGTDLYLGIPAAPTPAHTHGSPAGTGGDGHRSHCHADAASCSDVPFVGASPFALLSETVAFLGMALALIAVVTVAWRPAGSLAVAPEPRPPRMRSSMTSRALPGWPA